MRVPVLRFVLVFGLALTVFISASPRRVQAQPELLPRALADRGSGIPTSMFGTYIDRGQLLVYPFYEHVSDQNREYNPALLGFGPNQDFRGKYRSSSEGLFLGYGVSGVLAVEFETSYTRATLEKSAGDATPTPARLDESGLGDVEGQVRMRVAREDRGRPEIFAFLEMTAPVQRRKLLIGSKDWDFKPGLGLVRGFSLGTMTVRTGLEYNREQSAIQEPAHLDIGEASIEYLRRLSRALRLNLAFEGGEGGAPDEWEFRSGLQWRVTDAFYLKLDNTVGVSPKAPDWTPHIGLMFSLPRH